MLKQSLCLGKSLRGLFHREAGNFEAAQDDFESALAEEPDNPYAFKGLAYIYRLQKKYDRAVVCQKKAMLYYDEKYPDCYADLGDLYSLMGMHSKALETYAQVLEAGDENTRKNRYYMRRYAYVLARNGKVENAIKVLEELEDEKLNDLDFIELNCCTGGCVGGVLTVENPYVAKARIQRLRRFMPVSCNSLPEDFEIDAFGWTKELTASPAMKLADNVITAMKMMSRLREIEVSLPGLDCGICGAPSCRSLADDIVRGYAEESDCIFSKINLEDENSADNWLPAPFRIKVINEDTSEDKKNEA